MKLQRGNFTINDISELDKLDTNKDGIRRVIDLSYMGQFEYEGNTVVVSRMYIEMNKSDYVFYPVNQYDSLGVKHTDFSCDNDLSRGLFHCFNVVSFDLPNGEVKMYLVDCTYRQFFTYDECFTERIGIPLNEGANIGSFMMMDEARKKQQKDYLLEVIWNLILKI